MNGIVQTSTFHSDKCLFIMAQLLAEGYCLNRGDHVSVSFCPLHELSPAPVHISTPWGAQFSLVSPHMATLAASQREREREMFPRWSTWIIFLFEGHIAIKHMLHYVSSACSSCVSVLRWRAWGLPKSVPFISAELWYFFFSKHNVNTQSIKVCGFCFSCDVCVVREVTY